MSALRLAKGMAPSGKIAFLDTEARRGLHYAEQFQFMHADMRPPFRPAAFIEGIRAAEASGAEVVIIDSFSHEYDGEGGIMDWADELERGGTKSPGNWKVPKGAHKKLMNALLQCRASIIFCLRADEKIRIGKNEQGRTVVEPLGWMPICEKRFMFEMAASFTLTPDRPGIPNFTLPHKLQSQHRSMFSDRSPIGEDSGRALAEWARGGNPSPGNPASATSAASGAAQSGAADEPEEKSAAEWDIELGNAAKRGTAALQAVWSKMPKDAKDICKVALDTRHKPTAAATDQQVPA